MTVSVKPVPQLSRCLDVYIVLMRSSHVSCTAAIFLAYHGDLKSMASFKIDLGFLDACTKCKLHRETDSTLIPRDDPRRRGGAYGLARCIYLNVQDILHGARRAENNADSWSNCIYLKYLILLYPELDFLSSKYVTRRKKLLHHCSRFDCRRHPSAGLITSLRGYQPSNDLLLKEFGD